MQDGINVQAGRFSKTNKLKISTMKNKFSGKFSKINKHAGWNFGKNSTMKNKLSGKFSKINKRAG